MGTQDDVHFSYVEVQRSKVVAISNLHLPSDAYGPELVRDGGKLEDGCRPRPTTGCTCWNPTPPRCPRSRRRASR